MANTGDERAEFGQVQWGSGAVGWKTIVRHARVRNAGVDGGEGGEVDE